MAIPGFFGGLAFSTVLGIAGRHRRFDELSLPRFAAWGALGGLILGLILVGVAGLAVAGATGLRGAAVMVGAVTLLSTASASGLLSLARLSEDRSDDPDKLPGS